MELIRHIFIMGFLCPWIGGTLILYSAYLNEKVHDLNSAVMLFFTAAIGVAIFAPIFTFLIVIPQTFLSYFSFWVIEIKKGRITLTHSAIISTLAATLTAILTCSISEEIGVKIYQFYFAIFLSGMLATILNYQNWKKTNMA